jgi:hypothetical protein
VLHGTLRSSRQLAALKAADVSKTLTRAAGNEEGSSPSSVAGHSRMILLTRTAKGHVVVREWQTWPAATSRLSWGHQNRKVLRAI